MEKAKRFLGIVKARFQGTEVTTTSVMIAYYLLLSLFPIIIVVGNLLPYLNIATETVMGYLVAILPAPTVQVIEPVVRGLLTSSSGGLLSIGAIGAIWTSSKCITYLQRGLNKAYGISSVSAYLVKRIMSMATMLLILLLLVAFVVVYSFGDLLLTALSGTFAEAGDISDMLSGFKWPAVIIFLFCLLVLVYRIVPDVRTRVLQVLPGAALATAGLLTLVQGFTLYLRFTTSTWSSYGTIGAFFVLMFWLNFSAIIVLAGAVLNASIAEYRYGPAQLYAGRVDRAVQRVQNRLVRGIRRLFRRKKDKP